MMDRQRKASMPAEDTIGGIDTPALFLGLLGLGWLWFRWLLVRVVCYRLER